MALDLQYLKLLRLSLLPISGWPSIKQAGQKSLFNVHFIYVTIQVVVVIGELVYLHDIIGVVDFFLVGDVYVTTFLTILSVARLYLVRLRAYSCLFKKFLMEFHLIHFKHKGETFKKVFSTVDKLSLYFTLFMTSTSFFGVALFNLSPMYVNIKNGAFTTNRHDLKNLTLEFSVRYKYPGFDQGEKFIFSTLLNFYLSFLCTLSIIAIDLTMYLMIFQIIGHLEILAMNLKSMPKPKLVHLLREVTDKRINIYEVEMFDKEENLEIKHILKTLTEHHNLIISFTDNLSNVFGPMLGFTYLFHLISCCLLLLECSRWDPDVIVRFGPLTAIVFMQLIQISVIFEVLGHKSHLLIDCVYGLPWEFMDISNQRSVCVMLNRVQTPIQITAFGLAEVGVKTMANILKTTFSYFTFLQSL